MENASYQPVDLDRVNWDDQHYAIKAFVSSQFMEQSLALAGILSPPWVSRIGTGRFRVVDGFKRLPWARDGGICSVVCLVFPQDADPSRLMVLRLETKLSGPTLNVAEKAQVIAKLMHCLSSERVAGEYLPRLRIPPRLDRIEAWCRLAASSPVLLRSAASEAICERAALELAEWEGDAMDRAVAILEQLRCSASIQLEILEGVTEAARREGKRRLEILTDPLVERHFEDENTNHRQKTQAVRAVLTRLRFPRLSRRQERFSQEMGQVGFPGNIRLIPPPAFEGEQWQLLLTFSSPEEFRQSIARALTFASSTLPEEIMATEGKMRQLS